MVDYHFETLPQFQDSVYESVDKVKFVFFFSISMNLVEHPVICLGQYEAIFKHYIFTNKMWTNKAKCRIVPKDEIYVIVILAFQY